MKLGQGLGSFNQVLPREYIDTLKVLQDKVCDARIIIDHTEDKVLAAILCVVEPLKSEHALSGPTPTVLIRGVSSFQGVNIISYYLQIHNIDVSLVSAFIN